MITAPGPGGFSCPPLLQQAVCPPCLPRPSPSSGQRSPASSRETNRLPLTLALSDEVGRGIATVYVGPWSECQPKQKAFKRERRDTRTRGSSSLRENRPRSLPVPQPASPHFPLPWLPASSPSPSGPSSPPPQLGERQRNVVCRSVPEYQRRISLTERNPNLQNVKRGDDTFQRVHGRQPSNCGSRGSWKLCCPTRLSGCLLDLVESCLSPAMCCRCFFCHHASLASV